MKGDRHRSGTWPACAVVCGSFASLLVKRKIPDAACTRPSVACMAGSSGTEAYDISKPKTLRYEVYHGTDVSPYSSSIATLGGMPIQLVYICT